MIPVSVALQAFAVVPKQAYHAVRIQADDAVELQADSVWRIFFASPEAWSISCGIRGSGGARRVRLTAPRCQMNKGTRLKIQLWPR